MHVFSYENTYDENNMIKHPRIFLDMFIIPISLLTLNDFCIPCKVFQIALLDSKETCLALILWEIFIWDSPRRWINMIS